MIITHNQKFDTLTKSNRFSTCYVNKSEKQTQNKREKKTIIYSIEGQCLRVNKISRKTTDQIKRWLDNWNACTKDMKKFSFSHLSFYFLWIMLDRWIAVDCTIWPVEGQMRKKNIQITKWEAHTHTCEIALVYYEVHRRCQITRSKNGVNLSWPDLPLPFKISIECNELAFAKLK